MSLTEEKERGYRGLVRDLVLIFIALVLILYFTGRFIGDLNSEYNMTGSPIGSVLEMDNNVRRRFEHRLIWDGLSQNSSVYNGDIVRTSAFSQAMLELSNGDILHLDENSMIKVSLSPRGGRYELLTGGLSAQSFENSVIVAGGREFSTQAQASITVREETDGNFASEDGEALTLAPIEPPVPVFPTEGEQIRFSGRAPYVRFKWEEAAVEEGKRQHQTYRIEVADNIDLNDPVLERSVRGNSILCNTLEPGRWFWRISPDNTLWQGEAETVPFSVVYEDVAPPLELSAPLPDATVFSTAEKIHLSCQAIPSASSYQFELARDRLFTKLVASRRVADNFLSISPARGAGFEEGIYYWRAWAEVGTKTAASETRAFLVRAEPLVPEPLPAPAAPPPLEAPLLVAPAPDRLVSAADWLATRRIDFNWEPVGGADGYLFSLQADVPDAAPVINEVFCTQPAYTVFDITGIYGGAYIWTVRAVRYNSAIITSGDPFWRGDDATSTLRFGFGTAGVPKPGRVVEVDAR